MSTRTQLGQSMTPAAKYQTSLQVRSKADFCTDRWREQTTDPQVMERQSMPENETQNIKEAEGLCESGAVERVDDSRYCWTREGQLLQRNWRQQLYLSPSAQ